MRVGAFAIEWSGPVLLILFGALGGVLVRYGISRLAAGGWAIGMAVLGPYLLIFQPGAADERSLAALLILCVVGISALIIRRRLNRWLGLSIGLPALAACGFATVIPYGAVRQAQSVWGRWISPSDAAGKLSPVASEALVDRDLAHWIAMHAARSGAVVLAPPGESAALSYYGGLGVIGTYAPDNDAGFGATLTIAAEPTLEGVQQLLEARSVEFLVFPSWDPFFDDFATRYLPKAFAGRRSLLVERLRHGLPPVWLRPLAYQVPFAGSQSVAVFEVVPDQTPAAAAARYAEYLVEMGRTAEATQFAPALERFRADVGALSAAAQLANARNDSAAFVQAVDAIHERLATGADRFLPWDRRVSLTLVLAEANDAAGAQREARRCFAEASDTRLRQESAASLYNLLRVGKALGLQFSNPALATLAVDLLPEGMR
jgi:hypothetical protein